MTEYIKLACLSVMELVKYLLTYRIFFHRKQIRSLWHIIIYFLIVIIIQEILLWNFGNTLALPVILLTGLIIPLYFLDGTCVRKILEYIIIVLGVSVIDMFGDSILVYFFSPNLDSNIANIFSFLLLLLLAKRKNTYDRTIHFSYQQYLIFLLGFTGSIILLSGIQYFLHGHSMSFAGMSRWYIVGACVCTLYIVTSIYQIFLLEKNENYRRKMESYELYMKMQEQQLNNIILADKKQRAFKHDIQAHFLAIDGLIKKKDYPALEAYLHKAREESGIFDVQKYANHPAVDAIIENIIQIGSKDNIHIIWEGAIPSHTSIEIFDWCILISNLLTNAVEACQQVEGERVITARLYAYTEKICLCIKNPVKENIHIENHVLQTSKKDKTEHGYGSDNVKGIVDKYHGELHYYCEDYIFKVEIFL